MFPTPVDWGIFAPRQRLLILYLVDVLVCLTDILFSRLWQYSRPKADNCVAYRPTSSPYAINCPTVYDETLPSSETCSKSVAIEHLSEWSVLSAAFLSDLLQTNRSHPRLCFVIEKFALLLSAAGAVTRNNFEKNWVFQLQQNLVDLGDPHTSDSKVFVTEILQNEDFTLILKWAESFTSVVTLKTFLWYQF